MIGTSGGAILLLVNLVIACVLGIASGFLTNLVLRRKGRGAKDVFLDAVLAAVAAISTAFAASVIGAALGIWGSSVTLIMVIAVASVVARHVVRFSMRSSK